METKDIADHEPSLWIPITDPITLAHLGKLGEELGECSAIVSRCIIQGMDGVDPSSGKINRDALRDELADVNAMTRLASELFALPLDTMQTRVQRKMKMKRTWHDMLRAYLKGQT